MDFGREPVAGLRHDMGRDLRAPPHRKSGLVSLYRGNPGFLAVAAGHLTLIDTLPFIGGAAINTGVAFMSRGRLTLACAAGECTWGLFAVLIGAWPSAFMALFSLAALSVREITRLRYERQVELVPA